MEAPVGTGCLVTLLDLLELHQAERCEREVGRAHDADDPHDRSLDEVWAPGLAEVLGREPEKAEKHERQHGAIEKTIEVDPRH